MGRTKPTNKRKSEVSEAVAAAAAPSKSTSIGDDDDDEFLVVLPGDDVSHHIYGALDGVQDDDDKASELHPGKDKPTVVLGSGLRWGSNSISSSCSNNSDPRRQVFATIAGRLERRASFQKRIYFVRTNHKRYQYLHGDEDRVVGVVEDRLGSDGAGGDWYRVNIGASHAAILSNLSGFEGATKRNKPQLQPGQVLYARVVAPNYPVPTFSSSSSSSSSSTNNFGCGMMDPVLSCRLGPHDGNLPRKDWITTETLYGVLKGGTVCRISTGLARSLLHPDSVVLQELAAAKPSLAFEIAVGVNGFLWIHSAAPEYTILIQNAIQNSAVLTPAQVRGMVKQLVYTVRKEMRKKQDSTE